MSELTKEIKKEEASLRRCRDFEENISLINQRTNEIYQQCQKRNQKKLEKLIPSRRKSNHKDNHRNKNKKNLQDCPRTPSDNSSNTVVNLSLIQLSAAEISLLSKGLSFHYRPPWLDHFQMKQGLVQFTPRLRSKEYFYNSDDEKDGLDTPLSIEMWPWKLTSNKYSKSNNRTTAAPETKEISL